jgi:hypothetical protein
MLKMKFKGSETNFQEGEKARLLTYPTFGEKKRSTHGSTVSAARRADQPRTLPSTWQSH